MYVSLPWAFERAEALATRLRDALAAIDGVDHRAAVPRLRDHVAVLGRADGPRPRIAVELARRGPRSCRRGRDEGPAARRCRRLAARGGARPLRGRRRARSRPTPRRRCRAGHCSRCSRRHPGTSDDRATAASRPAGRGWLESRVRQARNPPPPVFRAVVANMVVAVVGAVILLAWDWLASRDPSLPDITLGLTAVYVVVVLVGGEHPHVAVGGAADGRPAASGAARRGRGCSGSSPRCPSSTSCSSSRFQVIRPDARLTRRGWSGPRCSIEEPALAGSTRWGSSSTVRAAGLYPAGSWFESRLPYHPARVTSRSGC